MSITCQICQREFSRQITNSHLKSHSMTTSEYKNIHGQDSLTCAEYKRQLSESRLGDKNGNYGRRWTDQQRQDASARINAAYEQGLRQAWNKGQQVEDPEVLANIRSGTRRREEKYQSGELIRASITHSDGTRLLLSQRQKAYAAENHEEMSNRARKALATKLSQGQDLAFFRGHHHTDETKKLLKSMLEKANAEKTEEMLDTIRQRCNEDNLDYISYKDRRVYMRCMTCKSEFDFDRQIFTDSKWSGKLCFYCYPRHYRSSQGEQELFEFVKSLAPQAISNFRQHYQSYEIDVYVPELQLGFEYNGLFWHSESCLLYSGKTHDRDNKKRLYFQEHGIRLVQIFEDEWINKRPLVESRIRNLLGANEYKLGARECIVTEIDSRTLNKFLNAHHIMGSGRSNIALGLYHNDALVSVMSFVRSNPSRKFRGTSDSYEMDRFCTLLNTTVRGAAQKLFQYFVRKYQPETVLSYSDNRWNTGNVYAGLGFVKLDQGTPNYWYFRANDLRRIHRYTLRKNSQDDQTLTEYENRQNQGYLRIWDCGSSKWVWTKK